jgi:hypothetical protein
MVKRQEPRQRAKGKTSSSALRDFLSRQEKDRLIDLLLEQAMADDRLFRKLTLEMAKGKRGRRPDLEGIRRSLSVAFDTGDYVPYREVYGYARGLDEAVDLVESLLKGGHAEEVIELAEHAMALTEEALSQEPRSPLSRQQQLQILPREAGEEALVGLDDGVGEVSLGLLELQDLLLDCIAGDDAAGEDGPGLADAVGAVDGLGLDGGVPPRIEQVDVVGGGQVEPQPSRFQADQEEPGVRIGLEGFHPLAAVAGAAVEILIGDPLTVELLAQQG